ncbi:MAG TPA: universal stress protein [Thermoanaerobaculia bacterium]|jgi:nucleotide-binding universal stress UspA family protein|nr:universal stress protein [Thermoanaerobaculia bacterium]
MELQPASTSPVVLAATDFSQTAAAALDWAVELARQQGARVELVHAVTVPPSMPGYVPTTGLDFEADVRQAAVNRLKETAAVLAEKGTEVATYLAPGTPSQVIVERAGKISALAIVIGTRGLTGLRHLLLGSTTQRVVHGARCPVLTVHPGDLGRHREIRTILVPTDFSRDADLAIRTAHELLAPLERDARLILLHAFNLPIEYTAYGPIPTSITYLQDTGLEAERRLFEMAQPLQREGLTLETLAREGDPAHVVAEEAEKRGADLIAMGTRGLSGLRHLLLGSTAERVVEYAPCPVMTIRRPD